MKNSKLTSSEINTNKARVEDYLTTICSEFNFTMGVNKNEEGARKSLEHLQACCNDAQDFSKFSEEFLAQLIKKHKDSRQPITKAFVKDFADALVNLKKLHQDFGGREDIFAGLHTQIDSIKQALDSRSFASQDSTQKADSLDATQEYDGGSMSLKEEKRGKKRSASQLGDEDQEDESEAPTLKRTTSIIPKFSIKLSSYGSKVIEREDKGSRQ